MSETWQAPVSRCFSSRRRPSRELHAFVADSLLPFLRIWQQLNVCFDSLQRTVSGTLREIVPKSDPATRTVVVKVSLPAQPNLVNGLFARLQVPFGDYSTLVVPLVYYMAYGKSSDHPES